MSKNNVLWSVFFSSQGISYTIGSPSEDKEQPMGYVPFEPEAIKKGYIRRPKEIQAILKAIKTENRLENDTVQIVLGEENLLFKKISIEKSILKIKDMRDYIQSQLGTSIHFPFDSPTFDYYVIDETDDFYNVLVSIADSNLVEDYVDMFESIHTYKIKFDNSYMATYRLFYNYHSQIDRIIPAQEDYFIPQTTGQMFVSLYHNSLTISIFDQMIPVFTMLEVLEDSDFSDMVTQYIERIANYYQYNIHKGLNRINHIEIFDYNTCQQPSSIRQGLKKQLTDFKFAFFDFSLIKDYKDELCHKGYFMALAASLKE
ncbi:MAG: pilus assembly protein PilM [Firmicutes bacterium]|nr:pilus assembly protein PilM [Bacillota bacterium]